MPQPPRLAKLSVEIAFQIFRFLRLPVRYDAQMMDVTGVSTIVKWHLPSDEEERQIWLANLEREV